MFKFLSREKFFEVINQCIMDGSKLESFGSYSEAEWVVLRGSDRVREEFYLFYDEKNFNTAVNCEEW